ncbi:MAG: alpha-E domain-containing protein [Pseudomonadota bacterium]
MTLSRIAENAFWMGRYIERADSFVQILSVTEAFASDLAEAEAWGPVLDVFADRKEYEARKRPITAANVAKFYLTDRNNPSSAYSCVRATRENARALRHLISTESWQSVSMFHDDMEALSRRRFAISALAAICEHIRESCCLYRGVIDNTWYRDEAWLFNRIGAALESADQTTRLLDMKYFQAKDPEDDDAAPVADVAWWNTLLRTASGYHAFNRRYTFNPQPADAAAFLLHDLQFPRSVGGAATVAFACLKTLEKEFRAKPGPAVKEAVAAFSERLDAPPNRLAGRALHKYLDEIQQDIIRLANALNERYFAPA